MTTKNFTDFDLRTALSLSANDFIVGYKADSSAEIRTTVRSLNYVPYIEVTRGGSVSQQRVNNTEYLFEWNTKIFETDSTVLSGNPSNYNIVISQPGFYEIESRYSGYDMSGSGYIAQRLRGSTSPITSFTNNLLELIDSRTPGIGIPNGSATSVGRTILRVATVPYFIVISYQGGGGTADGGDNYYTLAEPTYGTVPRIRVRKINSL